MIRALASQETSQFASAKSPANTRCDKVPQLPLVTGGPPSGGRPAPPAPVLPASALPEVPAAPVVVAEGPAPAPPAPLVLPTPPWPPVPVALVMAPVAPPEPDECTFEPAAPVPSFVRGSGSVPITPHATTVAAIEKRTHARASGLPFFSCGACENRA